MAPYVLVVEKDSDLQRRIGDALSEANYTLSAETELSWARRSITAKTPDAVVLDTNLPDGCGFTFAEEIRRNPATDHVPIFFVSSSHRGRAHAAEAKRRFAPAAYCSTPLDVARLLVLILETVPPMDPNKVPGLPDYPVSALPDLTQKRESRDVEAQARSLGGNALRGSLERQPFAHLLQRIYAGKMTGALLLSYRGVKKLIYFQDGYPVSVRSNVPAECLGQILLSQHLISGDALAESLRQIKDMKKPQGEILVEMGVLSPYNLSRALVLQMEAKLLDVFSWRGGRFTFKRGQPGRDSPVRLERSPAALILEGIRRHYDAERMHSIMNPLAGQYLLPSPDHRQRLQDITSDPNEQCFIDTLDGRVKFEIALATSLIPTDRAKLLLVAMAESGMILPSPEPQEGEVESAMVIDDSQSRTMTPPSKRTRDELSAVLRVMRLQDHFEVLALDPSAGEGEVDTAYQTRARDFHSDRFRRRPEDVRVIAERIFERLEEAHAVLSDSTARRRYLAQGERNRAQPEMVPLDEAPHLSAERVYFQGVAHLRARRYRDAAEAFRQATILMPKQASYRSALGWALYRQSPNDARAVAAGLSELRQSLVCDPENPWLRVSLGRFLAETGQIDEAIREFEQVLRMSPGISDIEEEIRRLRGTS
jgi:CheY-like chemotaxis protein/Flp pilus assembly protein TadD